eukprot:SAG31_NODE_46224_length_255_cov_0.955128_1_plen_67_part_10
MRFDQKFWKFRLGFPTGIANGRELADIYLHMLERQTYQQFATQMIYCRRYVDDLLAIIPRQYANSFI